MKWGNRRPPLHGWYIVGGSVISSQPHICQYAGEFRRQIPNTRSLLIGWTIGRTYIRTRTAPNTCPHRSATTHGEHISDHWLTFSTSLRSLVLSEPGQIIPSACYTLSQHACAEGVDSNSPSITRTHCSLCDQACIPTELENRKLFG